MTFPDKADREVIAQAQQIVEQTAHLSDWVSRFAQARQGSTHPIDDDDQFELLKLRRAAYGAFAASRVPVAAAVYGPSQVGKSLFVGQVLEPHPDFANALGRDEGAAQHENVSFRDDLNPTGGGGFESTALVTRFTTKERMPARAHARCPVAVRPLTRAQWLCVLAKGFTLQCVEPPHLWNMSELDRLFKKVYQKHRAAAGDLAWRSDLLDAYTFMNHNHSARFCTPEHRFNGLLGSYPLSEDGYVELAATLFWAGWDSLTGLFRRVADFLREIEPPPTENPYEAGREPLLVIDWRAVRFLLDAKRFPDYRTENFGHVQWRDFRLAPGTGGAAELKPSTEGREVPLEILQAAMSEMVIPVLPSRLTDDWRQVLQEIDVLDFPGLRVGRNSDPRGKLRECDKVEDQLDLVMRGKVAFLFEQFTAARQIQTLLVLIRSKNLEVAGALKAHVELWGKSRFSDQWPEANGQPLGALFIGLTGCDDALNDTGGHPRPETFDTWMDQVINTLSFLNNYGGAAQKFRDFYVLRFPGSWDTNQQQRARHEDPQRWQRFQQAFLQSGRVRDYVADSATKLSAAMRDDDGAISLIAARFRESTDSLERRHRLLNDVDELRNKLQMMPVSWVVSADVNAARGERRALGDQLLGWLTEDPKLTQFRLNAVREGLSLKAGDADPIANLPENNVFELSRTSSGDPLAAALNQRLTRFLEHWAGTTAPKRWRVYLESYAQHDRNGFDRVFDLSQFGHADFARLAGWLKDFLLAPESYERMTTLLLSILRLRSEDPAALMEARRRYVGMVLNDYILNPGSAPLPPRELTAARTYGVATEVVTRWEARLGEALADGVGKGVEVPPGNQELLEMLAQWNVPPAQANPPALANEPTQSAD